MEPVNKNEKSFDVSIYISCLLPVNFEVISQL